MTEKTEWLCDPVEVAGMGKSDEEYFAMLSFCPFGAVKKTLLALPLKDIGERTGWQLLRKNGLPKRITGGKTIRCYVLAVLDEEDAENSEK